MRGPDGKINNARQPIHKYLMNWTLAGDLVDSNYHFDLLFGSSDLLFDISITSNARIFSPAFDSRVKSP